MLKRTIELVKKVKELVGIHNEFFDAVCDWYDNASRCRDVALYFLARDSTGARALLTVNGHLLAGEAVTVPRGARHLTWTLPASVLQWGENDVTVHRDRNDGPPLYVVAASASQERGLAKETVDLSVESAAPAAHLGVASSVEARHSRGCWSLPRGSFLSFWLRLDEPGPALFTLTLPEGRPDLGVKDMVKDKIKDRLKDLLEEELEDVLQRVREKRRELLEQARGVAGLEPRRAAELEEQARALEAYARLHQDQIAPAFRSGDTVTLAEVIARTGGPDRLIGPPPEPLTALPVTPLPRPPLPRPPAPARASSGTLSCLGVLGVLLVLAAGGAGFGYWAWTSGAIARWFGRNQGAGDTTPRAELLNARKTSGAERRKLVEAEGGNDASEQAVARGLRWLALHQAPDGHWGLHDFNKHARTAPYPDGNVFTDDSEPNTWVRNDVAGTALALLPFLGAGLTHRPPADSSLPDYHRTVKAGLDYLLAQQVSSGERQGAFGENDGSGRPGQTAMYAHGLATIAVCEAYALTSDPRLRASAQSAIDFLVRAQHDGGGWRYRFKETGDLSVTGWQLMALESGRMAGLNVPADTLRKVERFLDSSERGKGLYSYLPKGGESPSMTAVGALCRQYLGVRRDNEGLRKSVEYIRQHPPGRFGLYYEYYATQVMHNLGGDDWRFWNLGPKGDGKGGMRDALVAAQDRGNGRKGHEGSWAVNERDHGGRLYATALSLLTLEVYYRHLPLYRREGR
jgi:hypothetical protein